MSNPNKASNPPMSKPHTVPEPTKPTAEKPSEKPSDASAGGVTPGAAAYTPGAGPTAPKASEKPQNDSSGDGMPGPADVWQLAFWSVTPPADDTEATERRTKVRAILLALVDQIAWE